MMPTEITIESPASGREGTPDEIYSEMTPFDASKEKDLSEALRNRGHRMAEWFAWNRLIDGAGEADEESREHHDHVFMNSVTASRMRDLRDVNVFDAGFYDDGIKKFVKFVPDGIVISLTELPAVKIIIVEETNVTTIEPSQQSMLLYEAKIWIDLPGDALKVVVP